MKNKVPRLNAGDRCRLLRGTQLYDVIVEAVSTCFEGEPNEFSMYAVRNEGYDYLFIREEKQHRSNLFLSTETDALLKEIDERIESLEYMKKVLEDAE